MIREILAAFRRQELPASEACRHLELGRTRFYQLYSDYLRACAQNQEATWTPGTSGGDHAPDWPPEVQPLMHKLLSVRPPPPYRFVASEILRRLGFELDPATVRRWALALNLAHPTSSPRSSAATRRWQCLKLGALWQLDATPHPWFAHHHRRSYPLLDLLDDCTRLCTGARIFHGENLLAYLDFLPTAFREYGLPLELYVDCHSLFFPQRPDALTQLGAALHFYGVSLRYARTPQAKGKIERQHFYWQRRLPSLFAAENIVTPEAANALLQELRLHRNAKEIHRELGRTPNAAARLARKEGRNLLRPAPRCPWWPYVWSQRSWIKVGPDRRVPIGSQRLPVPLPPGSKVLHCLHPSGSISLLAHEPDPSHRPALLLSLPAF